MAERRMFAKSIVESDAFLGMSHAAQALYFHLSMQADDDGFINRTFSVMRAVNASQSDMDELVNNGFIIPFETGIFAIKHWKMNNYIQKDRYKPTAYTEEKSMLNLKRSGAYTYATDEDEQLSFDMLDFVSESEQPQETDKNVVRISVTEACEKIYKAYPRKQGKAKGYEYVVAYLTNGRKLSGLSGRMKYNHEQLYCAVREYQFNCEDSHTEQKYIQMYSTFMSKSVIEYIENSEKGYKEYMRRTYGDEWQRIKFVYY